MIDPFPSLTLDATRPRAASLNCESLPRFRQVKRCSTTSHTQRPRNRFAPQNLFSNRSSGKQKAESGQPESGKPADFWLSAFRLLLSAITRSPFEIRHSALSTQLLTLRPPLSHSRLSHFRRTLGDRLVERLEIGLGTRLDNVGTHRFAVISLAERHQFDQHFPLGILTA